MFFIMTSTSNTPALFHSSCGSFIEAQTPLVAVNMTSERLVLSLAPREFKLFEATELEWTKMPLCLNECTFWMLLMIDLTGFLVLGVDLTRTLCTNVHMTATPHETSIQLVLRTSSCSGVARFSRVPPTEAWKSLDSVPWLAICCSWITSGSSLPTSNWALSLACPRLNKRVLCSYRSITLLDVVALPNGSSWLLKNRIKITLHHHELSSRYWIFILARKKIILRPHCLAIQMF